uniref:Uncharacterized protein n=2 Tax=Chaetoceros debilis TaxID=122233 RepID=A0A6S8W0R0_9STRA
MKYQIIFSALFFGSSFADAASSGNKVKEPRCEFFDEIKMEGGAELIDTNDDDILYPLSSGYPIIKSGDMTIGELYTGVEGVPTQLGTSGALVFKEIEIAYKSVCIVTKDQDPIPSSPTCFYEFELGYCVPTTLNSNPNLPGRTLRQKIEKYKCRNGRFTAHGSGPDNLQITGGSDDFFGAFGQIKTPNPFTFDFADINQQNGDLATSSIDMTIELCFYDV